MKRGHLLVAPLAILAACGTRNPSWDAQLDVVGPTVAAGELVWVNRTEAVAEALDPSGLTGPVGFDVVSLPRAVAATPGGFLVSGGRGDDPQLDVVSLPAGTRQTLHVAGAYDHIDVAPDGLHAVLYFDPAAPPAPGAPAARNNNEVTVVDLGALTAQRLALGTESLAPESTAFSSQGDVAAVILDGTVVLIDLEQPEHRVQVPLKLPGGVALHPEEALFAPDGRYLYVRASGSDDVLALEVNRTDDELGSAVNFLFSPGASGLADIAVPQGPGFERYVAALYDGPGGATAVLLDATGDSSRNHTLQLATAADRLDDLGGGMLLISSASSTAVSGWEPLLDRADTDALPAQPVAAPRVAAGHAFFIHPAVSIGAGTSAALTSVALVDDGARLRLRQNPLVLGGAPSASMVDPATGTLLLGIEVPREGSAAPGPDDSEQTGSVVTVDPNTLAIGGLVLDARVTGMGVVGGFGFATHPGELGDVSFFPLDDPTRATAHRVYGFLAGHLADLGEAP